MSAQKNKTIFAVTLAVVAVFLLGGVSFTYFPTQQTQQQILPSAAHVMWTAPTPPNIAFIVTGQFANNNTNPVYNYWSITKYLPMDTICIGSDGSVNTTNVPIKHQGDIYTLTGNIVNQTILIQKDNITLDGLGYTLQGWSQTLGDQATAISIPNRSNITITDLNIQQFSEPICIQNSTNITVKNSNITKGYPYAILLENSNQTRIIGNSFLGSMVQLDGSSNNQISNNTFSDSEIGITGYSGSNTNLITDNSFASVNEPIIFEGADSTISQNTLVNGDYGISVDGQIFDISKNKIANYTTALSVGSLNSQIYENNVFNSSLAVLLNSNPYNLQTGNNTFYHNNFINYSQPLQTLSPSNYTDRWDNGKEGNYWSSYTGSDSNGDGVGDTPYVLAENCTDRYPLMEPYGTQLTNPQLGRFFFIIAALAALVGIIAVIAVFVRFRAK